MLDAKWDERFLYLAEHVSTWSKDPSTKVGAVIADERRRVLSLGYNGFPPAVDDREELYADRDMKLKNIVHAEMNALVLARTDLEGATLYCSISCICDRCIGPIIRAGIRRVVVNTGNPPRGNWDASWAFSKNMATQAGVEIVSFLL